MKHVLLMLSLIALFPRAAAASCQCNTVEEICAPNDAYDLGPCCGRCGDSTYTCGVCNGLRDGGYDLSGNTPAHSTSGGGGCQVADHSGPLPLAELGLLLLIVYQRGTRKLKRRFTSA